MNGLQALSYPSSGHKPNARTPLERLSATDWSFAQTRSRTALDNLHPYPAKFIPDIPGALLDALPIPAGTTIFDPFAGSGTTLVEAQRRGLPSFGVDLNPIACLISRVRTAPLAAGTADAVAAVVDQALAIKSVTVPPIPNLDHWFSPIVQDVVARLVMAIASAPAAYQDYLRLVLSSILVRVSNQDSDTRYAAVEKGMTAAGAYKAFIGGADRIRTALQERDYALVTAEVLECDTLGVSADQVPGRVGVVITSPPYPNAYEYWLYHKYRMWWLGYDPLEVKDREIGARAHFFGGKRHTAANFIKQMEDTFALIDQVLVPEGYACFVVGRSKIHGEIVDNAEIIRQAGAKFDFREAYTTERVISATRKSFNLSHANIKTETVLVLSK